VNKNIGPGKFYKQCIFRKVDFKRSDEAINNFNVFLEEALGKKYGLDAPKLLRKSTVRVKDADVVD